MVVRGVPPELVPDHARLLEASLDELWIVEDCFYAGGISQLGAVLDATEGIVVGHGIAPAPFRNPAALAMEWATLARLHPGRLQCGIGHGVEEWMLQVGAGIQSPVTLLRETVEPVIRLLNGETVSYDGTLVRLDGVRLEYPPSIAPKVSLGVRGPVSLRLAGEVSDGAILSEWSSAEYITWARRNLDEGRKIADRADRYRLAVFVGFCFTDEPGAKPTLVEVVRSAYSDEGLVRMVWPERVTGDPTPTLGEFVGRGLAVGSAEEITAHLKELAAAGADALILVPIGDPIRQLERAIEEVVPALSSWPSRPESRVHSE